MAKDKEIVKSGYVLPMALSVILLVLIIRNCGLYPFVFPDEYKYSTFSRLIPLTDANIPAYLFYAIYKVTKICGDSSLECARILNSVFFLSAAPLIYSICKNIAGHKTAVLIAVCSVLSPINSYTAYFMPESLYFFVFWLFNYFVFRYRQELCRQRVIILGGVLGLLSLVKPHALLLIPALMAYFLMVMHRSEYRPPMFRIKLAVYFLIALISVKLVLGFALAGVSGLCAFGPSYTAGVTGSISAISPPKSANSNNLQNSPNPINPTSPTSPTSGQHRYLSLIENAALNLQGHLLALCLQFSVPLAYLLLFSCSFAVSPRKSVFDPTAIFTMLMFTNILVIVAMFTATISGAESNDLTTRIHARYYDFMFPLFLIVTATQTIRSDSVSKLKWRLISVLPVSVGILYAMNSKMSQYYYILPDNPALRGFTANTTSFYVLCLLSLMCLAVWVYSSQAGAKLFLYLFVPAFVVVSGVNINKELQIRRTPDLFDKAGLFAKHNLTREDRSRVVIVGSDKFKLYRSLLNLDSPTSAVEIIPIGAPYDASNLPDGKDWALVIGDHAVPDNVFYKMSMNGYTLVRPRRPGRLSFKTDSLHGVVSNIKGLYPSEFIVGWSTGKEVLIEFCDPLPERFQLSMTAYAFGPNVGRNFVIGTGTDTLEFTLGASPSERVLEMSNPGRSRIIRLVVPQPDALRELGPPADNSMFGLALVDLRIDLTSQNP